MILRALATRLLNRHLAQRVSRLIPHPGLRAAAMLAASVFVPLLVERVLSRAASPRGGRRPSRRVAAT